EAERATRYTEMDAEQNVTDVWDRIAVDDGAGLSLDLALELEHEFASEQSDSEEGERQFWERDDELSFEVEFERGRDGDRSLVERRFLEEFGATDYVTELTWKEDRETESELALSVDYLRGIGEETEIELGYEGEFGWTDESRLEETRLSEGGGDP